MRCLSIHLTDLCNSQCSFCVVGSPLQTRNTIDYEQVVHFIENNAGQRFDAVNLHGGEPTIHPHFFDTLNLIQRLGYPEVHLQTNAISLADPDFAKRAVDSGVQLFIVSLHGDVASLQDQQTGTPGGFDQTVNGIRNVKAFGARVRTNTVITRQNVERLLVIAELAIQLRVDHLNFSNLHPAGSAIFGLSRHVPWFADVRKYLFPALDLALARERKVTLEGFPHCTVRDRLDLCLKNEYREVRMLFRGQVLENYDNFMNETMRAFGAPCSQCSRRDICGGVYVQYTALRGWSEFAPILS